MSKRDNNIHLSNYQILLNLNKLSYSNANNYKNCMDLFKTIKERQLNFWEKIILNLCTTKNNDIISNFIINFGCFKYFKLYYLGNFNYSEVCECDNSSRIMFKKSKDGFYWFFSCRFCRFYKSMISYKQS